MSRASAEAHVIERATRDPEFRRELLADPRTTLEKMFRTTLPGGIEIRVLEETAQLVYLVLPPVEKAAEVSESELAAVAGVTGLHDESTYLSNYTSCEGCPPPSHVDCNTDDDCV
jgi:hypothetical protein